MKGASLQTARVLWIKLNPTNLCRKLFPLLGRLVRWSFNSHCERLECETAN
jgi:hypothetical protein